MPYPFPYGQTVTIVRRSVSGQDEYGNDVYSTTTQTIPYCVIHPAVSNENINFTDQVSTEFNVYVPAGTVVGPLDAVLGPDGTKYEVQGDPQAYVSPFSGLRAPIQIRVLKVAGMAE